MTVWSAVVRTTEEKSPPRKTATPASAGTPRSPTTTATIPACECETLHVGGRDEAKASVLFMLAAAFQGSFLRKTTAETQTEVRDRGASPPTRPNDGIFAPSPAAVSPRV